MTTAFLSKIHPWLGVDPNPVSHTEKAVATTGAFLGIFLVTWISLHTVAMPAAIMVAGSMGASAVLLFAVPHGQLSQPWAVLGGHLISAAIGVSCATFAPGQLVAAALAVSLAIGAMHIARCIHPPGGATALIAVIGGTDIHALGYSYIIMPIGLNIFVMLVVAIAFNYLFAWRRYPAVLHAGLDRPKGKPGSIAIEDIEHALHTLDTPVDVIGGELLQIYELAEKHAATRCR